MEKELTEFGGCYRRSFIAHRNRTLKECFMATFQRRIIGVGYDIEWPPGSSCDFFFVVI